MNQPKPKAITLANTALLNILLFTAAVPSVYAYDSLELTSAAERTEAKQFVFGVKSGKPKIGLALGGGGARGAALVGVLKVLEKENIKYDYIVGTSIGSVVGGFLCLGAKAAEMEEPFVKGDVMKHFMTVPLTVRIVAEPILIMPRLLGANPYDGLYGGKTFRKYLMGGMSVVDQKIEDLPIKFAAVSFNIRDGKPYLIRKGNLAVAMQASCAVPSLRKPVEIEDQLMADGGVICNLPVKQCRQMGADFVIAINIDEPFKVEDKDVFRKPGSIAKRMLTWGLYDTDDAQEQLADVVIHPDTGGIGLLSTKTKDAKRGVKAGEEAAQAALPHLREKLNKFFAAYAETEKDKVNLSTVPPQSK